MPYLNFQKMATQVSVEEWHKAELKTASASLTKRFLPHPIKNSKFDPKLAYGTGPYTVPMLGMNGEL